MATILIIDDQAPIRTLLRTVLESVGHTVCEAENGRNGLLLYRERGADLIITDIAMPEMNGLDLIVALSQGSLNVKVIAMSGEQGSEDNLLAAQLLGVRHTLQKPFSMKQLLNTVHDELTYKVIGSPTGERSV